MRRGRGIALLVSGDEVQTLRDAHRFIVSNDVCFMQLVQLDEARGVIIPGLDVSRLAREMTAIVHRLDDAEKGWMGESSKGKLGGGK